MLGPGSERAIVGHEQDGQSSALPGVEDDTHDLLRLRGVELACHLVGQQQGGGRSPAPSPPTHAELPHRTCGEGCGEDDGPDRAARAGPLLAPRRALGRPSSMASSTFCRAVRNGIRFPLWSTTPTRRARSRARATSSSPVISSSSKYTRPESGNIKPATTEISVDFPLPDTPVEGSSISPRGRSQTDLAEDLPIDRTLPYVFETASSRTSGAAFRAAGPLRRSDRRSAGRAASSRAPSSEAPLGGPGPSEHARHAVGRIPVQSQGFGAEFSQRAGAELPDIHQLLGLLRGA